LVELMVVIVIIGLLASVVTFSVRTYLITSKQNIAKVQISKFAQAIETFYTTYDRYPSNEEGLEVLTEESDELAAGLFSSIPDDPWGNRYEYISPGRTEPFEIICYGADNREGGAGADKDIRSDELGG
jgi:general secretion pathway protein G